MNNTSQPESLKTISVGAIESRTNYNNAFSIADAYFRSVDRAATRKVELLGRIVAKNNTTLTSMDEILDNKKRVGNLSRSVSAYDERMTSDQQSLSEHLPTIGTKLSEAKQHYVENEAAYHDIAVIEAHVDGVQIVVDQPLTVGTPVVVSV